MDGRSLMRILVSERQALHSILVYAKPSKTLSVVHNDSLVDYAYAYILHLTGYFQILAHRGGTVSMQITFQN
jgi:hypothetical protein